MDMKKLLQGTIFVSVVFTSAFLYINFTPSKKRIADEYYLQELTLAFYTGAAFDSQDPIKELKTDMQQDGYSNAEIGMMIAQALSEAEDRSAYFEDLKKVSRATDQKKEHSYKVISWGKTGG